MLLQRNQNFVENNQTFDELLRLKRTLSTILD